MKSEMKKEDGKSSVVDAIRFCVLLPVALYVCLIKKK